MKKTIFVLIAFILSVNISNASNYNSITDFSFSKQEITKIAKEKILIKAKLEKTFPKYKWFTEKLDKWVYNKLADLWKIARLNYLSDSYEDFYNKYQDINSSNYSQSQKNLRKLIFKYMILENYTMYYYNK